MPELKTRDLLMQSWRRPTTGIGETMLYDEPGRVLILKPESNCDVCYQAYYFVITKAHGIGWLYVKHGAGQEIFRLGCAMLRVFDSMTSDQRFFTCHAIMDAAHEGAKREGAKYRQAHAENRLKRKKRRGQNLVDVWIEREATQESEA